jgi:hypothetical protein
MTHTLDHGRIGTRCDSPGCDATATSPFPPGWTRVRVYGTSDGTGSLTVDLCQAHAVQLPTSAPARLVGADRGRGEAAR